MKTFSENFFIVFEVFVKKNKKTYQPQPVAKPVAIPIPVQQVDFQ